MRRIRRGDEVIVIAGKDKGRRGSVLRVVSDKRLLVDGVNVVKRHTRPDPSRNRPGGIIEKEASLDVSNVMLFNAQTNKGDRVGFRTLEDGRKVRFYKSTGEVIDG